MLALEDQVSLFTVIDVLLELTFDLEGRRAITPGYFHMFSLLVEDAKRRCAIIIILLFERDHL